MYLEFRILNISGKGPKHIVPGIEIIENGYNLTTMTFEEFINLMLPFTKGSSCYKNIRYLAARIDKAERHRGYPGNDKPGEGIIYEMIRKSYNLIPDTMPKCIFDGFEVQIYLNAEGMMKLTGLYEETLIMSPITIAEILAPFWEHKNMYSRDNAIRHVTGRIASSTRDIEKNKKNFEMAQNIEKEILSRFKIEPWSEIESMIHTVS